MSSETQTHSEHKHNTKPGSQPPAAKHSDVLVFQQANPAALVQRAAFAPPSLSANNVHQLQRAVGNQAVGGLVGQASNQKKGVAQQLGADVTRVPNGVIVDPQEKDIFLEQLHAAVCETASEVLGPTWSASSCPQIQKTFKHYALLSPGKVERIMQRFSGVSAASKASDYIAPVCARIRGTIRRWGLDEEDLSWEMGASDLPIALESNHSARGKRAKAQLKRKAGAGAAAGSVVTPDDLGRGMPIDSGTAARMGQAFGGENFGDVRIHTEAAAAQKTRDLNAGAMAMGSHVAFAPGEYQPGTPSGDSLIAHELAHVIQQRGSEPFTQRRAAGVQPAGTPQEHDADQAASAVVARLHSLAAGGEASASMEAPIRPALASGLGVQCGDPPDKDDVPGPPPSIYRASPQEKARAISAAYDELEKIAAEVAQQENLRFKYWEKNSIIKDMINDGKMSAMIKKAMATDEGQDIVRGLCGERYSLDFESASAAILRVPRKRRRAEERRARTESRARAAGRRLVPRQTVGPSDKANDKENKFIINKHCDDLLKKYPQALDQSAHGKKEVAAAVEKAVAEFKGDGAAMMLSGNYPKMYGIFEGLLKDARQKGYPVWDVSFLKILLQIATALTYLGTSGSVNAEREKYGGDKAKMRR